VFFCGNENKNLTSQILKQIVQLEYPSCAKVPETRAIHSLNLAFTKSRVIRFAALTLVKVTERLIRGRLSLATVRRTAMIMNVGVFAHNLRQKPFINVARGEICLSVVTRFIRIVELKFERLGQLVICKNVRQNERTNAGEDHAGPSLFPA
jgi:hypothetical protein